ncbi:MAG: hypothetical protein EOL98_12725 [Negativicutes bacterium]|nr:hypothetical protein [Negativicutes bacterium]
MDHQCSRQCGKYYTCRYRQAINQLNQEDIMIHICSHKYYMNEIVRRSKGYIPLLPAHAAVIIEHTNKAGPKQLVGTITADQKTWF